ncbi:hypothetical protein K469DRAFT_711061 [Zopfia rhizophila CBS 207.26]|uniref:Uncharacterized protein n=1 Tax=Zopfia rhizophila CBS 207.26 TaxID=1314779 RepID=A0A6A6DXM2_9PEZI|nr:hypothetical protein K469DRAFT_711061 [Zopfia rhizophila CBS 207.26]
MRWKLLTGCGLTAEAYFHCWRAQHVRQRSLYAADFMIFKKGAVPLRTCMRSVTSSMAHSPLQPGYLDSPSDLPDTFGPWFSRRRRSDMQFHVGNHVSQISCSQ